MASCDGYSHGGRSIRFCFSRGTLSPWERGPSHGAGCVCLRSNQMGVQTAGLSSGKSAGLGPRSPGEPWFPL